MPSPYSASARLQSPFLTNPIFFSTNFRRINLKIVVRGKFVLLATTFSGITSPGVALVQSHNLGERSDRSCENCVSNIIDNELKDGKRESSDFRKGSTRWKKVQRLMDEVKGMPVKEVNFIVDYVRKECGQWIISDINDLLLALIRQNEQNLALKLYSCLPIYGLIPDSRTFSIIIRCYCKRDELDDAKWILDCMLECGYHPNVTTFTVLIDSFCKKGKLQKAFEVLKVMGRTICKPTIHTYNCLLKGLCYVGRVEEAYETLIDIKNKNSVTPDIYTYTAVMDGFCKVGRSDEARDLIDEALEIGLTPSTVTYNTLFDGYCREGRPMKGFSVLKRMKQRNCVPDYITYSTLLNGLLKWGKIRPALSVYKEMEAIGFDVDERIGNRLFRGLCRKSWEERDLVDDAYRVFDKMRERDDYVADYCTHGLLIRTLCGGGRLEEAVSHMDEIIKSGVVPRTITFNNLIQGLSLQGKVEEALAILVVMNEHCKIPSRTSFDALIIELNRQGRLLAACNVYGAALKQNVIPHRKPLSYS